MSVIDVAKEHGISPQRVFQIWERAGLGEVFRAERQKQRVGRNEARSAEIKAKRKAAKEARHVAALKLALKMAAGRQNGLPYWKIADIFGCTAMNVHVKIKKYCPELMDKRNLDDDCVPTPSVWNPGSLC